MRSIALIVGLIVSLLFNPMASLQAAAQACDWYPSSCSPARGVARGSASFPCAFGQVKADWNTMIYRAQAHSTYATAGYEVNADTWCFDDEYQAQAYGFRRARY
jgi:hypothetical protein